MYAMFFMVWFAWIYCSLTISYDSITLVDVATMRRRHFISIITIMSSNLSDNVSGLSKKKKPQDILFFLLSHSNGSARLMRCWLLC